VNWNWIPWQLELIGKAFGTVKENGNRQYRYIYVEVPKKNGKSELSAAVGLKLFTADREAGAEIYTAAGDRMQASIIFNVAAQMTQNNKLLRDRTKTLHSVKRMVIHKTGSIYSALSSDAFTKHGLNPSGVLIDETHAHPNRELYDVLTEGTDTARSQQMIFVTTTAGIQDDTSIGWELHEYARQVKEEIIQDDTFLPIIYAADPDDDWEDPKIWEKVNPSLGYIFTLDKIQEHYESVKNNPARQNNFRRYRLNQWVSQLTRYIPMDYWRRCDGKVDPEKLLKHPCYGGLDLASKKDMCAFVLVFPPDDINKKWRILPKFYMPEATLHERAKEDKVPYDFWAKKGLITLTPGNIIDYEFIQKDVINASKIYDLREVAYDPWNATETAVKLDNEHGITMVEHRQGYVSMSEPTKKFHALILQEALAHGGHKVLEWNADNLEVKIDVSENVRPVKANVKKRIDGVVATIMALGRALQTFERKSKYELQGLTVL